jgi:hypothetical protein
MGTPKNSIFQAKSYFEVLWYRRDDECAYIRSSLQ